MYTFTEEEFKKVLERTWNDGRESVAWDEGMRGATNAPTTFDEYWEWLAAEHEGRL